MGVSRTEMVFCDHPVKSRSKGRTPHQGSNEHWFPLPHNPKWMNSLSSNLLITSPEFLFISNNLPVPLKFYSGQVHHRSQQLFSASARYRRRFSSCQAKHARSS